MCLLAAVLLGIALTAQAPLPPSRQQPLSLLAAPPTHSASARCVPPLPPLTLLPQHRSPCHGFGLFAGVPIRRDAFVIEYVGEVVGNDEAGAWQQQH